MANSFYQFIVNNFTLSVFVSVIVYKIFSIMLDNLVSPVILMLVDPNKSFADMDIEVYGYTIKYGESFRDIVVSLLILLIIYHVHSRVFLK